MQQVADFLGKVFHRAFLELGDTHPSIVGLDHFHAHRLRADFCPRDGDGEGAAFVFAPNGQNNLRIGLAAHALHGIGNCHAAHGLVVDARDHVACLEAGFVGGGAFDRRNNLDQTVFLADFDAHAHEFAAGFFLEFLEGFLVVILRVRIKP